MIGLKIIRNNNLCYKLLKRQKLDDLDTVKNIYTKHLTCRRINTFLTNRKTYSITQLLSRQQYFNYMSVVNIRSQSSDQGSKTTTATKLKKAVAEYGSTVIVFHITLSLTSLGICYILISSGVDITSALAKFGLDEKFNKITTNAGTFVVAYAVNKLFAPVRVGITLSATPFIVGYLRKTGWLKK